MTWSKVMRILLIHLSDLHIGSSDDPVLSRTDAICDAVQNLEYEPKAVIIIVSGDVAFSGQEMEYLAAGEFLERIRWALSTRLHSRSSNVPLVILTAAVPGNHDCNFTSDQQARNRSEEHTSELQSRQ